MNKKLKYYKSLDGLPIWKFVNDENDNPIYEEDSQHHKIIFWI